MGTAKFDLIQEELILWIRSLNDSNILNLLNSIKLSTSKSNKDWWDHLTEDQKENIQLGLKDLDAGNTISSNEFWKQLSKDD